MMQADATDMFGGDWEQIELGPGAGAGRPGQVIRLHPTTRQRHLDWLTWGLMPASTAGDHHATQPIHARAETVTELPMFAEAFPGAARLYPRQPTSSTAREGYSHSATRSVARMDNLWRSPVSGKRSSHRAARLCGRTASSPLKRQAS